MTISWTLGQSAHLKPKKSKKLLQSDGSNVTLKGDTEHVTQNMIHVSQNTFFCGQMSNYCV